MNWGDWLLWGFVGTVVLTGSMAGAQGLGLTRMDIPFLIGTMFTADRDRAQVLGILLHLVNGWIFAGVYMAAFQAWGAAGWERGALIGLVHGGFVLVVLMPRMPSFHPRMASDHHGPEVTPMLEPPAFLGLNYGRRTPIAALAAHVLYGAILGAFYGIV